MVQLSGYVDVPGVDQNGPAIAALLSVANIGSTPQIFNPAQLSFETAGTLARTMDSHYIGTSTLAAFTNGSQVAVNSISLPKGMIVSNVQILIGGTPANGPQHSWMALCDASLNVLAVSTDGTSTALPASTLYKRGVTIDGSNPYTVAATGTYFVAASVTTSTTAPTAAGAAITASVTGLSAPVLCGTAGTQAAPPAVGAQLASGTVTFNAVGNFAAWLS